MRHSKCKSASSLSVFPISDILFPTQWKATQWQAVKCVPYYSGLFSKKSYNDSSLLTPSSLPIIGIVDNILHVIMVAIWRQGVNYSYHSIKQPECKIWGCEKQVLTSLLCELLLVCAAGMWEIYRRPRHCLTSTAISIQHLFLCVCHIIHVKEPYAFLCTASHIQANIITKRWYSKSVQQNYCRCLYQPASYIDTPLTEGLACNSQSQLRCKSGSRASPVIRR